MDGAVRENPASLPTTSLRNENRGPRREKCLAQGHTSYRFSHSFIHLFTRLLHEHWLSNCPVLSPVLGTKRTLVKNRWPPLPGAHSQTGEASMTTQYATCRDEGEPRGTEASMGLRGYVPRKSKRAKLKDK